MGAPSIRKRTAAPFGLSPSSVSRIGCSLASASRQVPCGRKLSSRKIHSCASSASTRSSEAACTITLEPLALQLVKHDFRHGDCAVGRGCVRAPGPGLGITGLGITGLGITGLGITGLGITGLGITGLGITGLGITGLGITGLGITGLGITGLGITGLGIT